MFYSGKFWGEKYSWMRRKTQTQMLAWGNYKISLVQWLITNLYVILYMSTCHTVYISVLILFMIMPELIFNTYVSLIYELKKWKCIFTSKFVGTGPSSYEKWIYRAAVSQRLRNTALEERSFLPPASLKWMKVESLRFGRIWKESTDLKYARRKLNSSPCCGKPPSPGKKMLAEGTKNENLWRGDRYE